MKVYAMIVDTVGMGATHTSLEVDDGLQGKELLWQVDEDTMGGDPSDYDPVRFDKVKNTGFGVIGIGKFGGRSEVALIAVSKRNLSYLIDKFDRFIDKWPYSPYQHILSEFYEEID